MPQIAEIKEIDGKVWVRVDTDIPSPITIWTDDERRRAMREAYNIGYDDGLAGGDRNLYFP